MRTRSAVSSATVNRSVPARRPGVGRTGAAAPVAALTGVLILTLIALVPLAGTAPLLHFTGQAALVVPSCPPPGCSSGSSPPPSPASTPAATPGPTPPEARLRRTRPR